MATARPTYDDELSGQGLRRANHAPAARLRAPIPTGMVVAVVAMACGAAASLAGPFLLKVAIDSAILEAPVAASCSSWRSSTSLSCVIAWGAGYAQQYL